jgi:hypothetical protein
MEDGVGGGFVLRNSIWMAWFGGLWQVGLGEGRARRFFGWGILGSFGE